MVEFLVPVENNKTVFVWNIEAGRSEAHIYSDLFSVFSGFGPLYLLKLCDAAPGYFSALVKYYSFLQAASAQRQTDGKSLFQNKPLKVRLSTKQMPHSLSNSRPLSHTHCLHLANRSLGFNGWSSDIITLKELEPDEEDSEEEAQTLRLGCLLELHFPLHHLSTRGAAVVQDTLTCSDPVELMLKRSKLMKAVKEKALVQAFSSVLLILLGNGKVMLELKSDSHQFVLDEDETLLQVKALPCR